MIDAIANLQGRERSAIELSSLFNEEADSPSPQVVSNPKLVGWWMVHAMRLGFFVNHELRFDGCLEPRLVAAS
jgi:hypothetical protein